MKRGKHIFKVILIGLVALWASPAMAQDAGGGEAGQEGAQSVEDFDPAAGERQQRAFEINADDPSEAARQRVASEENEGPRLTDSGAVNQQLGAVSVDDVNQRVVQKLKVLLAQMDKDDPTYPEIMFRVSQFYLKSSRFHDLRQFELLDQASLAREEGNEARAAELEAEMETAKQTAAAAREEANNYFKQIINEYPLYQEMGKVLFYLAFNLSQAGRADDAQLFYEQLLREHPDSEFVPDALVAQADYQFMNEHVPEARDLYARVVQAYPNNVNTAYAMYKMGWCYYNLGQPREALQQFQDVIEHGERTGQNDLRGEAIKDLVKAFSLWADGDPRKAENYFKRYAKDDEELNSMMERLAQFYIQDGAIDRGVFVYNELIRDNRNDFKAIGYQIQIMYGIETFNDVNKTAQIIHQTVLLYNKFLADDGITGKTDELKAEYYSTLERHVRETAKWYHKVALRTKNPLYFALALELYRDYVENFPEANDSYDTIFYYAELLYWKADGLRMAEANVPLERRDRQDVEEIMALYAEAGRRYDQVMDIAKAAADEGRAIEIDPDGELTREAAHAAVLAYEWLLKVPTDTCPALPTSEQVDDNGEKVYPPMEIPECRQRFIVACDRFLEFDPDSENAPDIGYLPARIYYDYNQFEASIERFGELVFKHPEHEVGVLSANLLLSSYGILKDYEKMYEWVKRFQADERINRPPLDEKLTYYAINLAFKFCRDAEEAKDWVKSATCYEAFTTEYPDTEMSDKALWNAANAWQNASLVNKAINARIRLLKEYANSDLAPDTLYLIGASWHGIATYSRAAHYYELFAQYYPRHPQAASALSNAAAFRTGLTGLDPENVDKAVADYDLYVRLYPEDRAFVEQLRFNTGEIYFYNERYRDAIARFDEFRKDYGNRGNPALEIASYLMIAKSYQEIGEADNDVDTSRQMLRFVAKIEERWAERGFKRWLENKASEADARRARDTMAEARFLRAEALFAEAMEIQLTEDGGRGSESKLERAMAQKTKLMQEAVPIYQEVMSYLSPNWGLAALTRIGMMYHDIAKQIQNAPKPTNLNEDQLLYYEDRLYEFSFGFEDIAVSAYVNTLTKANELGWFNEYTNLARRRLFELRPQQYRSASEIMAQPNQALVQWHGEDFFSDVDAAREGRTVTSGLEELELSDEEVGRMNDEAEDGANPEGGAPGAEGDAAGGQQQ